MIVIFGYILGSAFLPFKSSGILLTQHISPDEMNKFLRAKPHQDAFDDIINRFYEGTSISGYEEWFDQDLLESLGLDPVESDFIMECDNEKLIQYRKLAVASLWYYPQVFRRDDNINNIEHEASNKLELTEDSPLTIIFLKNKNDVDHIKTFRCNEYLIIKDKPYN